MGSMWVYRGVAPYPTFLMTKGEWKGLRRFLLFSFFFLLSFFDFYVGVFGALPPFSTSFLVPKKEAKKEIKRLSPLLSVEKVRQLLLTCFLVFDFYVGLFGALPPFPTSFLVPKKEAKKASAAAPLSVFCLKLGFFDRLKRLSPLFLIIELCSINDIYAVS